MPGDNLVTAVRPATDLFALSLTVTDSVTADFPVTAVLLETDNLFVAADLAVAGEDRKISRLPELVLPDRRTVLWLLLPERPKSLLKKFDDLPLLWETEPEDELLPLRMELPTDKRVLPPRVIFPTDRRVLLPREDVPTDKRLWLRVEVPIDKRVLREDKDGRHERPMLPTARLVTGGLLLTLYLEFAPKLRRERNELLRLERLVRKREALTGRDTDR